MDPDDIVEAFVTTIIAVVMLVIVISVWDQDIGMVLVDLLPTFVELLVWLFIGVLIAALLSKLVENF